MGQLTDLFINREITFDYTLESVKAFYSNMNLQPLHLYK